jgi:hypothetical protein
LAGFQEGVFKPPQLPDILISIPLGTQLVKEIEQHRIKHQAGGHAEKQEGLTGLPGTGKGPEFLQHRY